MAIHYVSIDIEYLSTISCRQYKHRTVHIVLTPSHVNFPEGSTAQGILPLQLPQTAQKIPLIRKYRRLLEYTAARSYSHLQGAVIYKGYDHPTGTAAYSPAFVSQQRTHKEFYVNYENNQQDALYRLIYYSKSALHVSGDVFAHHQEHLTVFTISGSVFPSCCRLAAGSNLGEHYQML